MTQLVAAQQVINRLYIKIITEVDTKFVVETIEVEGLVVKIIIMEFGIRYLEIMIVA